MEFNRKISDNIYGHLTGKSEQFFQCSLTDARMTDDRNQWAIYFDYPSNQPPCYLPKQTDTFTSMAFLHSRIRGKNRLTFCLNGNPLLWLWLWVPGGSGLGLVGHQYWTTTTIGLLVFGFSFTIYGYLYKCHMTNSTFDIPKFRFLPFSQYGIWKKLLASIHSILWKNQISSSFFTKSFLLVCSLFGKCFSHIITGQLFPIHWVQVSGAKRIFFRF